MSNGKKKSGNKPNPTEKVVLIAAILELVKILIELFRDLIE